MITMRKALQSRARATLIITLGTGIVMQPARATYAGYDEQQSLPDIKTRNSVREIRSSSNRRPVSGKRTGGGGPGMGAGPGILAQVKNGPEKTGSSASPASTDLAR